MPPELTGEAPAAPEEVPDLDVSEEVFPDPPPEPEADETPAEAEEAGPPSEDEGS
jgi:hypothetical protein